MSDIEWGSSIPHNGGDCPKFATDSRCYVVCDDGNAYGAIMRIYGHEFSWFSVRSFRLPKDHPYYSETKETEQVYVCSLNNDFLVGTQEQLLDLMVEQGWTLHDFVNMTTYELGDEVKLKLTIE